jgi:hypothetical protein
MTSDDDVRALRATCRDVTLTVLGVLELFEADPRIGTAIARALGDVFSARLQDFERPRVGRGRAALRALFREIERVTNQPQ